MTATPANSNLTLLQALRASVVYEESKRWPRQQCEQCVGTGWVPATRKDQGHVCATCSGRGSILVLEARR